MATLAEAIQKAEQEVNKTASEVVKDDKGKRSETVREDKKEGIKPQDSTTTETEDDTENTDDTETDDEKSDQEDLSETELANAKQLFKAFKDPQQAPLLVKYLAEQAGYKPPETKTEAKVQAKDLVDQLKESVGPDLEFLVDKIGPTIKDYLTEQVDAVRTELANAEAKRESEKLIADTKVAITDLAQKYYKQDEFPKEIYAEMNKLMDKIQPSANMNPSEYIEMLYFTVAGKKGINIRNPQKVDRNRNDVPSRIEGQRGAKAQAVKEAPKKMTLNESIRAAMDELDKGES